MNLYVVVGEESGDVHAGNLLSSLKQEYSNINIRGFGGDNMIKAGVEVVQHIDTLSFMGITEVIINSWTLYKHIRFCKQDIIRFNPNAILLVDYSGFNLRIAKFAYEKNIKIFYYIPPKVWAWNKNRLHKIKKYVDELIVIFPFEVEFFKKYGVNVHYFGNPTLEHIKNISKNHSDISIQTNKSIISLLPGSRDHEIKENLPVMIEAAKQFKDYDFIIGSTSRSFQICKKICKEYNVNFHILKNETYALLRRSSAAVITSGTASLEAAFLNVPQIVCYKSDTLTYVIARFFLRIKWISLVNIVMNKEIVTELIYSDMNKRKLTLELNKILNKDNKKKILSRYSSLYNTFNLDDSFYKKISIFFKENL